MLGCVVLPANASNINKEPGVLFLSVYQENDAGRRRDQNIREGPEAFLGNVASAETNDIHGGDPGRWLSKRVFLSRGWGPGGYPAPTQTQKYVWQPPTPQPQYISITENILPELKGEN